MSYNQRSSYLLKEHWRWRENQPSARRQTTTCCVHMVLQYLKDLAGNGYLKGPVGEGSAVDSTVDEFAVVL